MNHAELAQYLLDVISAPGLTIPAVRAEVFVAAKIMLQDINEGVLYVIEAKEVFVPNSSDGRCANPAGQNPSNSGAALDFNGAPPGRAKL